MLKPLPRQDSPAEIILTAALALFFIVAAWGFIALVNSAEATL